MIPKKLNQHIYCAILEYSIYTHHTNKRFKCSSKRSFFTFPLSNIFLTNNYSFSFLVNGTDFHLISKCTGSVEGLAGLADFPTRVGTELLLGTGSLQLNSRESADRTKINFLTTFFMLSICSSSGKG